MPQAITLGTHSSDVSTIQATLRNYYGYNISADGSYGPITEHVKQDMSRRMGINDVPGQISVEFQTKLVSLPPRPEGFDVAIYQAYVDWVMAKTLGFSFAFIKATEAGYTDKTFKAHQDGARAAGMLCGYYDFFHPNMDPLKQARYFGMVIGPRKKGDLPPVLDLEVMGSCTPKEVIGNALIWLKEVEQIVGCKPILYTGPGMVSLLAGDPGDLINYELWNAAYTSHIAYPAKFTRALAWQYTDKGRSPAIEHGKVDVDLTVFLGLPSELQALAA